MTARFDVKPTRLDGLAVVVRQPRGDSRGFLERVYCINELAEAGLTKPIRQINRTLTRKPGTVRGLHFQKAPHAEVKFVSCLRGRVLDVAVDLRPSSPTFLQWHAEELSGDNHTSLLIPEGFAHGFQTLTDDCEMLYLHTHDYVPEAESGITPVDDGLGVAWPLPIAEMSGRDAALPSSEEFRAGLSE